MSSPADPTDPIRQLGTLLSSAERQVQEIGAAAERRAVERVQNLQAELERKSVSLDERAGELHARAAELDAIAAELLSAAAVVDRQVGRLRALPALGTSTALEPLARPHIDPPPAAVSPSAAMATAATPQSAPAPPAAPDPSPVPVAEPANDHDLPVVGGSGFPETSSDDAEKLDSARLVALSMAASGRSRSEVEAHLRNEMGIRDYGPLIEYVFGISTPTSIVPSWPPRRKRRSA